MAAGRTRPLPGLGCGPGWSQRAGQALDGWLRAERGQPSGGHGEQLAQGVVAGQFATPRRKDCGDPGIEQEAVELRGTVIKRRARILVLGSETGAFDNAEALVPHVTEIKVKAHKIRPRDSGRWGCCCDAITCTKRLRKADH